MDPAKVRSPLELASVFLLVAFIALLSKALGVLPLGVAYAA